ncbi:hypothetical protein XM38_012420 [Halomicronema hongdechloris C2206]|uniref:Uncharacterized protein n=1 Tax=Halomicronema hongdechloris C2206 TaxID=1641165 RepID=A0A1Z3HJ40_9CYAN|nr:hypothetical protein [Halomicronema hongdechloris]ASC70305.1 hypothetical protein XM38_012420 [Halomicronema hongdechloris C2206]
MTIDCQKQLLREICSEYDLETILDALLEIHDSRDITAYVSAKEYCYE